MHLIIDGYNILNAWEDLKEIALEDLDSARKKLIDILADYQGFKKYKITVVFDAHQVKGALLKSEMINGVEVIFTKEGETADSFIERYVYENAKNENIVVVTSDYLEQLIILGSGATRMPARQFKLEVEKARKELKRIQEMKIYSNKVEDQLDERILKILDKLRGKVDSD
ncbi:NYN domain-containing protein [Caldicellulosiruptoraceae bacterium PP1]